MNITIARRLAAVGAAISLATLAIGVGPNGLAPRAASTFLHLELGEQLGRVELLRPRGATCADQPSWMRPFATLVASALPQNGIQYHGGPVVNGLRVAAIYWAPTTIFTGGPTPGTSGGAGADGSLVGQS